MPFFCACTSYFSSAEGGSVNSELGASSDFWLSARFSTEGVDSVLLVASLIGTLSSCGWAVSCVNTLLSVGTGLGFGRDAVFGRAAACRLRGFFCGAVALGAGLLGVMRCNCAVITGSIGSADSIGKTRFPFAHSRASQCNRTDTNNTAIQRLEADRGLACRKPVCLNMATVYLYWRRRQIRLLFEGAAL
jgi:hypothetical protein